MLTTQIAELDAAIVGKRQQLRVLRVGSLIKLLTTSQLPFR